MQYKSKISLLVIPTSNHPTSESNKSFKSIAMSLCEAQQAH